MWSGSKRGGETKGCVRAQGTEAAPPYRRGGVRAYEVPQMRQQELAAKSSEARVSSPVTACLFTETAPLLEAAGHGPVTEIYLIGEPRKPQAPESFLSAPILSAPSIYALQDSRSANPRPDPPPVRSMAPIAGLRTYTGQLVGEPLRSEPRRALRLAAITAPTGGPPDTHDLAPPRLPWGTATDRRTTRWGPPAEDVACVPPRLL